MDTKLFVGALVGVASMGLASNVEAATIVVDVLTDAVVDDSECSLREAVASANADSGGASGCDDGSGDDVIVLPAGTIALTAGGIDLDTNLTILGAGSAATIIDAAGNGTTESTFTTQNATTVALTNLQIANATKDAGAGGALFVDNGLTTLTRVRIKDNQGEFGGAISVRNGARLEIYDSELDGNVGENAAGTVGLGGAIQNQGDLFVARSHFHDNDTFGAGGAIQSTPVSGDVTTEIWDSLFANNTAARGGAISSSGGATASLTRVYNTTFSGNIADTTSGGALHLGGGSTARHMELSHVTLTGNSATTQGGGLFAQEGTLIVANSLIADNTATTSGPDCTINIALLTSEHHNLIGDNTACADFADATDVLNGTAGIVALADNGGATMTHALDATSEARGAGDCIAADGSLLFLDQRGVQRTVEGACTIGAWDPHAVVSLTTDEPAGANCADGGTKLETGIDLNDNAALDANEVQSTQYVCQDATPGELVNVVDEPAGANCEFGGLKVESGTDADGSGTLDAGEVSETQYVCNGGDGELGNDGTAGTDGPAGETGPQGPEGSGCAISPQSTDDSWLLLAAMGLLLARRRRRS